MDMQPDFFVMLMGIDAKKIDRPGPDTTFSTHLISERPDGGCRALQQHTIHRVEVIEANRGAGNDEIVARVLHFRQTLGQQANPSIEHIGQIADAYLGDLILLLPAIYSIANEVTHGFRTRLISPLGSDAFQVGAELVTNRYRDPLHGVSLQPHHAGMQHT
ncbi:MAG: hypothetical protein K0S66_2926 [Sphingomonas sp.]|nr:hypothetical protein [Sphingomonas sp.]